VHGQPRAQALVDIAQEVDEERELLGLAARQVHGGLRRADPPAGAGVGPVGVAGFRSELQDVLQVQDGTVLGPGIFTAAREDHEHVAVEELADLLEPDEDAGVATRRVDVRLLADAGEFDELPMDGLGLISRAGARPDGPQHEHGHERDKLLGHGAFAFFFFK
jgi:hypothetical protein